MQSVIDYQYLRLSLPTAIKDAFVYLRQKIGSEQLYVFGLYMNEEMNYIVPTANTEEGLIRKAQQYLQQSGKNIQYWQVVLRWMPGDWEYHQEGQMFFKEIEEILEKGWSEDFSNFSIDRAQVYDICLSTLKDLDSQRFFGDRSAISRPLLNLFKGDRDFNQLLKQAEALNNPDMCRRFQIELEETLQLLR